MIKKVVKFFDRLEDKVRGRLSHAPIVYAFLGGVGVVLFWRGVWHTADDFGLGSLLSLAVGVAILLITGVFVSAFIGNRLIISGLSGEKKLAEKETGEIETEIETEEEQIENIQKILNKVETKIEHLEQDMHKN